MSRPSAKCVKEQPTEYSNFLLPVRCFCDVAHRSPLSSCVNMYAGYVTYAFN